jgi:hypothetical protein
LRERIAADDAGGIDLEQPPVWRCAAAHLGVDRVGKDFAELDLLGPTHALSRTASPGCSGFRRPSLRKS